MNHEISEADLVKRLHVARSQLRALRGGMEEGTDWRVEKGAARGQVVWLAPGLEKIRRLGPAPMAQDAFNALLWPPEARPREKAPAAPVPAAGDTSARVLTLTALRIPNPLLLQARDEGGAARLVRVKDKAPFTAGMRILARPQAGTEIWEYRGNPADPARGPVYPIRANVWPKTTTTPANVA